MSMFNVDKLETIFYCFKARNEMECVHMYKYKLLICTFLYLVNTGEVHVLTTFGTCCCINKAKTFFKNCSVHFMCICNIHGNVFNLCDIWNKPGWIYASVSSWRKLYHCEDWELELRWTRSEWNKPVMCCCQKRGGNLVFLTGAQGLTVGLMRL